MVAPELFVDPIFKLLEPKIVLFEPGRAVIEIPYKQELTRVGGVLHGGIIMTAMDITGGLAVLTVNDGTDQVTQELKINFLEPMYKGPFRVEGRVVRKGGTIVVVQIEFRDADGKLGAIALGSWVILRKKVQTENKKEE